MTTLEAKVRQRSELPTIRPELIKMGDVRDEPVRNTHDHCTRGQMSISLGERLIVPALLGGIYAFLSGGSMLAEKGATLRMRIIWRYSFVFILGTIYCMAWHDVMASVLRWHGAWFVATGLLASMCIVLSRRALEKLRSEEGSD